MKKAINRNQKLVRTKLRDKIRSDHPESTFQTLEGLKLKQELKKKLVEEAHEFLDEASEEDEELGDILEVIEALFELEFFNKAEVEKIKQDKYEEKGGFKEGLFWKGVTS